MAGRREGSIEPFVCLPDDRRAYPTVAAASLISGRSLTLGLDPGDTVLLILALAVSIVSFGTGRTTILTGLVHLVVFGAYLFLVFVQ